MNDFLSKVVEEGVVLGSLGFLPPWLQECDYGWNETEMERDIEEKRQIRLERLRAERREREEREKLEEKRKKMKVDRERRVEMARKIKERMDTEYQRRQKAIDAYRRGRFCGQVPPKPV